MSMGSHVSEKTWLVTLPVDHVRIRCFRRNRGKAVVSYAAQLELWVGEEWKPIIRYDNAHGFCHIDVIHADGRQEKRLDPREDSNAAFTRGISDLSENWPTHVARFMKEVQLMIDPETFSRKQGELVAEFFKFIT